MLNEFLIEVETRVYREVNIYMRIESATRKRERDGNVPLTDESQLIIYLSDRNGDVETIV